MEAKYVVIIVIGLFLILALVGLAWFGYNIQKAKKEGRIEGQRLVDEINAENAMRQGTKSFKVKYSGSRPYTKAPKM